MVLFVLIWELREDHQKWHNFMTCKVVPFSMISYQHFLLLRGHVKGFISCAISQISTFHLIYWLPILTPHQRNKKTILPLKNVTPAHWFRIQPAHCLIKHKLKYFFVSLSPGQLHLLQSIVTAARYQSTQGQASLFAITVCYTWLFINHPNKDRFLREN